MSWSDDFTSPTLHERWMLLDGQYTPPGLSNAVAIGPDLGGEFTLDVDTILGSEGLVAVVLLDDSFSPLVEVSIYNDLTFVVGGEPLYAAYAGGTVTLRRAGGHWSVLVNGTVATGQQGPLTAPDTHTGPAVLALEAHDAAVTRIAYTGVVAGPDLPENAHYSSSIASVFVGGQQARALYLGDQLVWQSIPPPALFAEFPDGDLLRNSGSVGGQFLSAGGYPSLRAPYGAWLPSDARLEMEAPATGKAGFTAMGWFKASRDIPGRSALAVIAGSAFVGIMQSATNFSSELVVQAGNDSYIEQVIPNAIAHRDAWIHLGISLEPDSGGTRYTVYVNGEVAGEGVILGSLSPGSRWLLVGNLWEGDVGRVRLFTEGPLAPAQVARFYNSERNIYPIAAPLPPRYIASESGGTIGRVGSNNLLTIASHVVASTGIAKGTWQVRWNAGYFQANTDVRVLRNGLQIALANRTSAAGDQVVDIPEGIFSSGDTLTFQVRYTGARTATSDRIDAWAWSLS